MARPDSAFVKPEEACKRSVRYLRVSTKRQMDTDADAIEDGNSIDTQRKQTSTKERTLGAVNVGEYIEPGNSAQSIEKRPEFRKLLKRIMEQRDVDYVVIDLRSRAFRNHIDAAIVKRQLEKLGVKLISAREDFGDGVWADAMEAITDVFNEVQVKLSGQDISLKMLNKAANGGTPNRAKIGYQNISKIVDGHKINTIDLDPERHHLITAAFDIFATGGHTTDSLHAALVDAGLTIPATGRPVSIQTVQKMLRDPYYIGHVVWKGVVYTNGRHQPLISVETFERVQRILNSHSGSGTRFRTHPHYLKGLIWCGRCKHRFTLQRAVSRQGGIYYYFLCRGRQDGLCDQPYVPVEVVEQAVADHYAHAVNLPADFIAAARAGVESVTASDISLSDQMRATYTKRLAALARKESYFLDLAAEEGWPKDTLRAKIDTLRAERSRITGHLDDATTQLDTGKTALTHALDLLDNPAQLYQHSDETVRAIFNEAFFARLYLDGKKITDHEYRVPFTALTQAHRLYREYQSQGVTGYQPNGSTTLPKTTTNPKKTGGKATHITSAAGRDNRRAATPQGDGSTNKKSTTRPPASQVRAWSGAVWVDDTGIEPVTSSVSDLCSYISANLSAPRLSP